LTPRSPPAKNRKYLHVIPKRFIDCFDARHGDALIKLFTMSLAQDVQQWFIHALHSGSIKSVLKPQADFIYKFKDPNEDDDIFEDEVDSVNYSSWNNDLDGEVVSGTLSSSLVERELIEINKDEVVDKIPSMNRGMSPSCDDLFDNEHTLAHETLIFLSSEVKNEIPLHCDIEFVIQSEDGFFNSEEVMAVVVISK